MFKRRPLVCCLTSLTTIEKTMSASVCRGEGPEHCGLLADGPHLSHGGGYTIGNAWGESREPQGDPSRWKEWVAQVSHRPQNAQSFRRMREIVEATVVFS